MGTGFMVGRQLGGVAEFPAGQGYAAAVAKAIIHLSTMEDPRDETMARTITGPS